MLAQCPGLLVLLPVLSFAAADDCKSPYEHDVTTMDNWEQELMVDCPESAFGRLSFNVTTSSVAARANFILGLKALHNFDYSLCTFEFSRAIENDVTMCLAYWGKALCLWQSLWNLEEPEKSGAILGQAKVHKFCDSVTPREKAYFESAMALNDIPKSQFERIHNYYKAVESISKDYPDDETAAAFVALSSLALGSVGDCASAFAQECTVFLDKARGIVEDARQRFPDSPGVLHYGLHAHDFPNATIYKAGYIFAIEYPNKVKESCHSLHMSAHIHDRAGNFADGASANHISVLSADKFARSGALSMDGGPIQEAHGLGFKYNAGNLYHSLEYESYELLQQCLFDDSRALVQRMSYATRQHLYRVSLAMGEPLQYDSSQQDFSNQVGNALVEATTFSQWSYRMQARQLLHALFFDLLGAVDTQTSEAWRATFVSQLPVPLAWQGKTEYNHSFYSPQSEAGLWSAVGLAYLADWAQQGNRRVPAPAKPDQVCGDLGCVAEVVDQATHVIAHATQHYENSNVNYEAAQMKILGLELAAFEAYLAGNDELALGTARDAAKLDVSSKQAFLPGSTSLMFMEGDLFLGVLLMVIYRHYEKIDKHYAEAGGKQHMMEAKKAFETCLSPLVRPNHTVCLLGHAQASHRLGDWQAAKQSYELFLKIVTNSSRACSPAVKAAEAYIHSRPARQGGVSLPVLVILMVVSACISLLVCYLVCGSQTRSSPAPRAQGQDTETAGISSTEMAVRNSGTFTET